MEDINMFDIFMYFFENYIYSEVEIFIEENEFIDELVWVGFNKFEIYKVFDWLE